MTTPPLFKCPKMVFLIIKSYEINKKLPKSPQLNPKPTHTRNRTLAIDLLRRKITINNSESNNRPKSSNTEKTQKSISKIENQLSVESRQIQRLHARYRLFKICIFCCFKHLLVARGTRASQGLSTLPYVRQFRADLRCWAKGPDYPRICLSRFWYFWV